MKKIFVIFLLASFLLSACANKNQEKSDTETGINESYVENNEYKYKVSDLKTDKEERVYAKADANGNISNIEVETTLKSKQEDELKDVNILKDVINTSGDENYKIVDNMLVFENHGADITYKGSIDKELPVNIKLTYYLDGKEIEPEKLIHKSGHIKINIDYLNNTKIPFICLTVLMLDDDKFSNIETKNGKLISSDDLKMLVLYGEPNLKENLMLYKTDIFNDLKLNNSASFTATVNDFTLDYTSTFIFNGLFKEIEDKDLNKAQETLDNLSQLNENVDNIKDASNSLKDEGNSLKDGISKLNNAVNTLDDGINQYNDKIGQIGSLLESLETTSITFNNLINDENLTKVKDNITLCKNILDTMSSYIDLIISLNDIIKDNNENIDKIDLDKISDDKNKEAIASLKKIDLSSIDIEKLNEMKDKIELIKNELDASSFNSEYNTLKENSEDIKNICISMNNDESIALFIKGMANIKSGSNTLKTIINNLNNKMPDMIKVINKFADEINKAIDNSKEDLDKVSSNDLKIIINNIKEMKINDSNYDSFIGKLEGMTSSVSFIIETKGIN